MIWHIVRREKNIKRSVIFRSKKWNKHRPTTIIRENWASNDSLQATSKSDSRKKEYDFERSVVDENRICSHYKTIKKKDRLIKLSDWKREKSYSTLNKDEQLKQGENSNLTSNSWRVSTSHVLITHQFFLVRQKWHLSIWICCSHWKLRLLS